MYTFDHFIALGARNPGEHDVAMMSSNGVCALGEGKRLLCLHLHLHMRFCHANTPPSAHRLPTRVHLPTLQL
jgi:hypothetical protein